MVIDVKNLILFTGVCHMVQFLVFSHQYKTTKNIPGSGWWILWTLAEIAGFILILLREIPSLVPVSIIFQNIVLLSGTIFIYFGIRRFFDKDLNLKFILPFLLIFSSLHLFFSIVIDDIVIRSISFNAAIALIGFLNAFCLFKNRTRSIYVTVNFLSVLFIMHGLIFVYRTIMIVAGMKVNHLMDPTFFNISPYFDALVVGLLWTYGFILLLNQKLNLENSELRTRFELIFNTSPDAVVITRLEDGLFFDCNEGYTKLMGYTKDDLFNRSLPELNIWKNPDDRKEILAIISERGSCENYEVLFRRKDGEVITGLISAKILVIKGVQHIIGITRDISNKKADQEKERKYLSELKELNAVKDKLFSILGHDLRGPFSAIIGLSELLTQNIDSFSTAEIQKIVNEIHKSGVNTFRLLENILNWAKSQTGQIKINLVKTRLDIIVQEAVKLTISQADDKRITINYLQPSSRIVVTDENILNTVLRNLLSNAIKFTNSGGVVNIETRESDRFIKISVSDNGIGMSEEIKNSLFADIISPSREGTHNEKGTGLGLAICKELIERLGGTILVESEAGKGSTFSFTLPVIQ
jgi:PAS domain S-box-containing protein